MEWILEEMLAVENKIRLIIRSVLKEEFGSSDLIVYHGSPYNFLKFSNSNIGTGEGNNSFGYGIYFTGIKLIAEYYAKTLSENVGYLYSAKIKKTNFLNWTAPIDQDNLERIILKLKEKNINEIPFKRKLIDGEVVDFKAGTDEAVRGFYNSKFLYENLSVLFGSDKGTSKFLLECGIDGIVYDANTLSNVVKNKLQGFNYVIFDENNIEIIDVEKIE